MIDHELSELDEGNSEDDSYGHTCFLYESQEDRLALLATYFQTGLDRNELCIFVTPDHPGDVIQNFKAIGHDIAKAVDKGAFRIFDMNESYLPDGQFASDFMLQNVRDFMADAKDAGYKGLRTAGEMAWVNQHPEFVPEAIKYEADVNKLTTPQSNFTGLCLYPVENSFTQMLSGAIETHPTFVYDGDIRLNPNYSVAHG